MTKRKSSTRPSVVTPLAGAEGKGGIKGSSPKITERAYSLVPGLVPGLVPLEASHKLCKRAVVVFAYCFFSAP